MTKKLLMGNEAIAHAALEAGVRVVAGYPGTPSSEIVETVAKERAAGRAEGVHVEWSTNEKAALELLGGASYAGARCLYTCKQMGLNVASDPLMCLNYVGVKGGLVLIVADDPGPISSQTEQDTRRFGSFSKVPVLDPSTPDQAFAMVKAAFELSERYRTPVIVRPTTRVDHASAFFDIADRTRARDLIDGGFVRDPSHWVIFPRRAYEAHGEINERLPQIARDYASDTVFAAFNPLYGPGLAPLSAPDAVAAQLGIVAGGISAAYTLEALRLVEARAAACGAKVPAYRFWQVGTPYPFPEDEAARFAQGLERVIVFEELDSVLEDALTLAAGRRHLAYDVLGKKSGDTRDRGENDVDDIAARLVRFFGLEAALAADDGAAPVALPQDAQLPARPPVLCPGCPHRGSFYAIKRALGKTPAVLCGDIGCYTLGNAQPLDAVDTCLCMGAGITQAQGFSVVEPGRKAIAYVGDSTFFASGMTGIANAAYNGHDITVVVLDNATTAMTGAQPHPGTGVTLMGPKNEPISIEAVLAACNFKKIVHADPLDLDAAIAAAHEAIFYEGPSAVLFESPCIQLIRPQAPVEIDHELCTGCKRCITEIGCPGIGFDPAAPGPKSGKRGTAFVDASLCNGCGLCVDVCPFSAIMPTAETAGAESDAAKEGGAHA
ncbi:MAG: thiamine pyrophosphate-dependent enzyme [Eggerthellaceae bacterium]|jgi:indolepyruvate ferredoxin oxidoreductase alpha subunit